MRTEWTGGQHVRVRSSRLYPPRYHDDTHGHVALVRSTVARAMWELSRVRKKHVYQQKVKPRYWGLKKKGLGGGGGEGVRSGGFRVHVTPS